MNELRNLLAPVGREPRRVIPLRLVRKRREPLLLIPRERAAAQATLSLYPAQTPRARIAKSLLGLALRIGLPLPNVEIEIAETAPLARFLAGLEGVSLHTFGVAFGNPRAAGRRFLILLFDEHGRAVAVAKAGASAEARERIAAESGFLSRAPALDGVPRLRASFETMDAAAFALDFIAGASPRDDAPLAPLLTAWLDHARHVPLGDLPAWSRVAGTGSRVAVHPTLMHGDFAPWNVRAHEDRWTLVDWERGERDGVPGWDWLHFVVQRAVLVGRLGAAQVRERIAALLRAPEFISYAEAAGFAGSEELIARGYIRHCAEVLRPTECANVFAELATLMPLPA